MKFISGADGLVPLLAGAFLVAAAIALVLTPIVRRLVSRRGIVDAPNHRRVNTSPVPRGGGIAVVLAFLLVGGGLTLFRREMGILPLPIGISTGQLIALFGGGILAALIGAADDVFDLRARWQFGGQIVLALFAVALGIGVVVISNPFGPGPIVFAAPFAVAFTIVWIIGMLNSMNFIDGLDGLSTGIALIAALTLGILSLTTNVVQPYVAVMCVVLAGALLGFLRFNFQPASIFQGTTGVMFMGYTLAILSILGSAKVVVAILVLGVPIIDTFWVIVRRLSGGRSPFTPDRGHIHHRLLDLGLGHRGTVLLIYAICASLGVMSLVASTAAQVYAFLGALVGFGVVLFLLTRGTREALEPDSYDTGDST
ncbi:MAG: undecaprenyl/decaprenyl-phosphate alpha-N-acetylglucosaminyl 1-phosphate transferase [Chloroflexota bacterium]|nr:MAG: undecaprenyl/decaprenyl-phosphate alpha-N-acetylglucosaminyl 1-phosphate transferase [Chloroflexota bacterium]